MGRLTPETLLPLLGTRLIGRTLRCCGAVDSTFKVMRSFEKEGAPHGTVVSAEKQTQGRGRFSRKWESPEGTGLYFNLLLRPPLPPEQAARIIPSVAVGVCNALRSMGYDAGIKWPNDLVISGKKVCGMLAEMGTDGQALRFVSVGIGLNVLQTPADFPEDLLDKAGSLAMFSSAPPDRAAVFAKVLDGIEAAYDAALADFPQLLKDYKTLSVTLGRPVQASGGAEVTGLAVDINENGELIVQDADGLLHTLRTADVSVRGVMGYV